MPARLPFALAVSTSLLFASFAHAQALPVHDLGLLPGDLTIAPATNSQQDFSAAKGGEHSLVAWTDYRARSVNSQSIQSDGDIFGVRIDQNGNPVDPSPFLIAGGMGLQQRPLIAWNGENWLVVFTSQDAVAGFYEDRLRAVRISPQGQVLDATPLVFPATQFVPDTIGLQVSGHNGQWLVTRCLYHGDGYGTYLAGQRISGSGQLLDTTPLVLNDWVYGATRTVVANGEYIVVGPDWNTSTTIKARRIGLNGQPIGASFNVPSLDITSNGSECYVVWISGFVNLVGSRMTTTGTLLNPAGTMLVPDFGQYNQSTLAHDGTQWWLEWGASDDLHTIRIDATGVVLDPGGGVAMPITIGGNINTAYTPTLLPRTGGGVQLLWYDLRVSLGYDTNVFALPVSAANVPDTERCLSTGSCNQRSAELAAGPGGTSAVVLISEAANDDRILVHFLDASGNATAPEPIEVHRAPTLERVGIACNGSVYMIAWDEGASGSTPTQVRSRRMNPDGTFLDPSPVDVLVGFNAAVGALGDDFLVVAARFGLNPQFIDLRGRRIDGPTGAPLDASPILLASGYVSGQPRVRNDGAQWLVAAHSQWSHDSSQGDAFLTKVPPVGAPTPANNPTPFSGGTGDLDIAFSGNKYLLVWRMNSLANANNAIAGRIMNLDGSFPPGSFTIAEAPGRQLRPTLTWDGGTFIVAWEDQRNQGAFFDARTDIYAARVSESGAVLDPAGIAVDTGPQGDAGISMLSRNGATFVASSRFMVTPPFDTYRVGITRLGRAPCPGDFNGSGAVTVQDIFDFLAAFFANDPAGDFNHSGTVTPQDIFDFLAAYFTPCL